MQNMTVKINKNRKLEILTIKINLHNNMVDIAYASKIKI